MRRRGKQPDWLLLLEQVFALLRFEVFDDFGDVLSAVAGNDEERVGGFDDNEIIDADGGDEFRRAVEQIAGGVERVAFASENIFAGFFGEQFVDGGPGADVAPADFSGDDENLRRAGLLRGVFQDGVIHGNIFELGIDGAKFFSYARVPMEAASFSSSA